jgi:hypothetical protein
METAALLLCGLGGTHAYPYTRTSASRFGQLAAGAELIGMTEIDRMHPFRKMGYFRRSCTLHSVLTVPIDMNLSHANTQMSNLNKSCTD